MYKRFIRTISKYPSLFSVAKISLFACSIAGALSTPYAAYASDSNDIERIVTTATRTESASDDLPLIVSALDEDTLRLNAHSHIQESLMQIAGVNLHRGNGQEYLPALRSPVFTGAGACGEILTTEDGLPIRAAGFCNINELFEAHSEMAQRIEVLKGPGSAFYGSNAIHGVINVITPDTTRGGGFIGTDQGSYGFQRYKLRAGQDYGTTGVGVNASITRDSGYRDEESVDQEKINLRYRVEGDGWETMTGMSYTNLDQETAGFITGFRAYTDKDIAQSNFNPEAYRKARALRIWSRTRWQLADNSELSITPYLRNQNMDFLQHFLPGTPLEQNAQTGFGLQSSWKTMPSDNVTVYVGLDAERTEGELQQTQSSPTQGSAFLVETVPQGAHYDYDVTATQISPFAHLEWQVNNWLFSAGMRWERLSYDYSNNMLDGRTREDGSECGFGGCRYSRPASSENSFTQLSPKLGAIYQITPSTNVYANVSQGYRAPQATELYRLQREQQVADLEAVKVDSVEIGLRGSSSSFRYVLSAYLMQKDNVIFRDSDFFNVSNGETKHAGIELEASLDINDSLNLAIAFTQARHTYENDRILNSVNINGNDIDTAPRRFGNARINWFITDSFQATLEWQHMGDYYTDPENLNSYSGHDLLNIRSVWQINDAVNLYARMINVTDRLYAERADFTGFSGDRYFPGKPRTVFFGLDYMW